MIPKCPLPLPDGWESVDAYVESLLSFATSSATFRTFCGGIHVLDFLIREPDLYSSALPEGWRRFFEHHEVGDILDLLLREDIEPLQQLARKTCKDHAENGTTTRWRDGPFPPPGLLDYIYEVRRHSLTRSFSPATVKKIPLHVAVGMKPKKRHEVENFADYVNRLLENVNRERDPDAQVTHIVDFGSGQNYLGRALASPSYNKRVIAIERHQQYITGARGMDVSAKLAKKKAVMRNKKQFRAGQEAGTTAIPLNEANCVSDADKDTSTAVIPMPQSNGHAEPGNGVERPVAQGESDQIQGHIDYIEHEIEDGYLEPIIKRIIDNPEPHGSTTNRNPSSSPTSGVMVISLHSCGNLVHHGIRSLILNPSVTAIAMIGCCYNLMTERLGPPTWKLPILRSLNARLERTSTACDPHGFPMSRRFEKYPHEGGEGIRLNISARMMAVQAPENWTPQDCESFFTRHFYRALLQRVLVDYGVIPKLGTSKDESFVEEETSSAPLIIGALPKSAFTSFPVYARVALAKLSRDSQRGTAIQEILGKLSDDELELYAQQYGHAKKNLSIIWSLMAFSAAVTEAIIVTDRWQFLQEQEEVRAAWVETVFDYSQSPRNLAVVGIKK